MDYGEKRISRHETEGAAHSWLRGCLLTEKAWMGSGSQHCRSLRRVWPQSGEQSVQRSSGRRKEQQGSVGWRTVSKGDGIRRYCVEKMGHLTGKCKDFHFVG